MVRRATVIEVFSGCGGFSTGLLRAGYDVRIGVDNNAAAITTYNHNHSDVGSRGMVADVRTMTGRELIEHARVAKGEVDLLVGGPPCQPFSIVGKRLGLDDVRGDLVFEYARLLREIAPRAFIFENVANFARMADGQVAEMLMSEMAGAGYSLASGILNAHEYGVAQARKRFIIVGVRGRKAASLPDATHGDLTLLGQKRPLVCRDVLEDLPDVDTEESLEFSNHEGTSHSSAMLEMFRGLKPGTRDPKSHHDRLHADRPSYTLRAGNGNFSPLRPIHYRFDRVISVRESARIQGFPDDFVWPDEMSRLQQYRQVGNAVPPPLAESIGRHLATLMGFELDPRRYANAPKPQQSKKRSVSERISRRNSFIRGASVGRQV